MNLLWRRGLRLLARAAVAFALSTAVAIGLGAAITDSALVQILVTVLAAVAFWAPLFVIVVRVDQWFERRRMKAESSSAKAQAAMGSIPDELWRRFAAVAPTQTQRLDVLRRSLERSRVSLGSVELDPDANELCILIDRRLPDLISHELECLPPDDLHRAKKVGELIDLVEQFARHCSRRGSAAGSDAAIQAEVLRRRFEARLAEF
jgi:hypothetical protein